MRELQNVVERAVILCAENGILGPEHLGLAKLSPASSGPGASSETMPLNAKGTPLPLDELEKRHILAVLEHCKGNRTHASRILGVSIRTLRNKLHEYNGSEPEAEAVEESSAAGQG